jgi:hypothetical protein
MTTKNCTILRGLNSKARRDFVNLQIKKRKCTIVCLQETNLATIDQSLVLPILGPSFVNNFAYLPTQQTRGDILLACSDDFFFTLSNIQLLQHSLTANVIMMAEGVTRAITVVYGPQQGDREKIAFLEELKNIATPHQDKWIVLGDFGLMTRATPI